MKRNWKYDKQISLVIERVLLSIFIGVLLLFSSCNNAEEHKYISSNKTNDLGGLEQRCNQTVFSDVKTITAEQKTINPILNATGVISYDPQMLNIISARYSGRIEKLYVRFNFENVTKGQRIMDVYSPEILTAQENLIYLLNNSTSDNSLVNSSKQKLQLLGLTDEQIKQIETTKQAINPLPVYCPYNGHIHDMGSSNGVASSSSSMSNEMGSMTSNSSSKTTQEQIENLPSSQTSALTFKEGMYVQSGQSIFAVYNTDKVWAVLNIFPQDAALIKVGDKVSISDETNPENVIAATINYIEPVAGQNASAIKARVYLQNTNNLNLRIGTLVSAKINSKEISGIWLPRNAVVNLGQKQVVFLKNENHFNTKTIQTGIITDSLIQIINGLKGNEQVAANAQFLVDSESFIKTNDNENK